MYLKTTLNLALCGLFLFFPGYMSAHMHEDNMHNEEMMSPENIQQMNNNMSKMRDLQEKINQATTEEDKQNFIHEMYQLMQENMKKMHGSSGMMYGQPMMDNGHMPMHNDGMMPMHDFENMPMNQQMDFMNKQMEIMQKQMHELE